MDDFEDFDDTPFGMEDDEEEYDDGMDGDAASAFASIGWGTDEDYGMFSDE